MGLDSVKNKLTFVALMAVTLWSPQVYGADLTYVFQRSLKDDPLLSSANYLRYAAQGDKGKLCGELFPQVTLPGSYTNYEQDEVGTILGENSASTVGAIEGNQWSYGVMLNQTLFDMPRFTACRAGRIRVNHNDAKYEVAYEDLIYRVVQAYINVLSAKNDLKSANSTVELFEVLLEQEQKSFSAKTTSKREVDAVAAKLEVARANKVTAYNNLMVAKLALEDLANGEIPVEELAGLQQNFPLMPLKPSEPSHWAKVAEKQNLKLMESALAMEIAEYGVKSANSEHWPTINVFARHSDYDSDIERTGTSVATDDGNFSADAVGVKFAWKIFTGGSNTSAVKSAKNHYLSAQKEHEAKRRSTRISAQRAVANLLSYEANIKASTALLVSSKADLDAVKSGAEASTRTATDVLDAKVKLLEAESGLDSARYDYIVGMVEFWKVIGALSAGSIKEINHMLIAQSKSDGK